MRKSEPKCTSFFEEWNQSAIDVASHESFNATKELATNEHGRNRLSAVGRELEEDSLDVRAGDMVVELDDGGANAETKEEAFSHGAHATTTHAEQDYSVGGS